MAKIVLIEDDEELARTIKSYLELESHLVTSFHDGTDGLEFLLANDSELIILDWDLPGMEGIDVLRNYRNSGGKCPVLFLTGHTSIENKEEGFDSGADDYLIKPFNSRELSARVKALLRRSESLVNDSRDTPVSTKAGSLASAGAAAGDAREPLIGTNLGDRYELLSVIARGGMGVVYRSRHILLDKIVAIKLLNETYLQDPSAFARFQHEAKVACQLTHANIVAVHDFGITEDKMLYLVMDYIEGQTLAEILDDQANLPVERVIEVTRQLCEGLEYAHDKDLIHRDLKPSNLMIVQTKDGHDLVKILDFGLAKFTVEGKQQALSQTGYVLGTGFYMSPEQCRGKPADVRSEIYAVGCVLYEAITGLPPFVGENLLETCQKHIEDTAVPMCEARPDLEIPEAVESVVRRALEKDPQARFQSASDLKKAIAGLKKAGLKEGSASSAKPATTPVAAELSAAAGSSSASAANTVVMPGLSGGAQTSAENTVVMPVSALATAAPTASATVESADEAAASSSAASQASPNSDGADARVQAAPNSGRMDARSNTVPILASAFALVVITGGALYYSANHKTEPGASNSSPNPADAGAVVGIAVGAPDPTFTKRYRDAVSAFEKEQYSQAEKLLQSAVLDARHAGSKSELLIALRKLEDVLYVQKKFKDADLLDQEIHRLAAAAPDTASAIQPVSADSFKLTKSKTPAQSSAESTSATSASTGAAKSNDTSADLSIAVASSKESQDDRIAHLALACHKNGQCDTAVSLLQHSIEVSKRMYGPHSLKTAERLTELATLYTVLDQPNDAQPLMNEVMEIKAHNKARK